MADMDQTQIVEETQDPSVQVVEVEESQDPFAEKKPEHELPSTQLLKHQMYKRSLADSLQHTWKERTGDLSLQILGRM